MHDDLQQLNARIEQRHWWFVARRHILAAIVRRLLPAGAGHIIVDIGCGTGSTLAALKDGYRCIGLDTSDEAVRLGRLRHREVQFAVMKQWEDGSEFFRQANLILLNDVLEHIEHEVDCFRQLVERAPPGVFFLITVPADPAVWSPHDVVHGHITEKDAFLEKIKNEIKNNMNLRRDKEKYKKFLDSLIVEMMDEYKKRLNVI